LAEWAGISVPPNTRCLIAEVGGVGRDYPLSIEKLSPILAYYVVNGLEEGVSVVMKFCTLAEWGTRFDPHT